jgi:hypothetical protein
MARGDRKRLRLVSRKLSAKTQRQHVSSSSDGIVDVAAQVEMGLIERNGIVALLPDEVFERAKGLLEHNELKEVKEKLTPAHRQLNNRVKLAAIEALPKVIGPLYGEIHQENLPRALNLQRFTTWLQRELETPGSRLNLELERHNYDDLVELQRSDRWWCDIVAIRS